MDDIQFWIYLIFAAIYFLTRNLRKRSKESEKKRPRSPLETQDEDSTTPKKQSQSFEDLLREVTGQSEFPGQQKEEEREQEIEEPEPFVEAFDKYKTAGSREYEEEKGDFEEGKTRRFSDEESREVYERSIRMAEGSDLTFDPDESFRSSKLKGSTQVEEEENEFVKEIRETLANSDEARKAIILSEIINRKY